MNAWLGWYTVHMACSTSALCAVTSAPQRFDRGIRAQYPCPAARGSAQVLCYTNHKNVETLTMTDENCTGWGNLVRSLDLAQVLQLRRRW